MRDVKIEAAPLEMLDAILEKVRNEFLGDRHLVQYVDMFAALVHG